MEEGLELGGARAYDPRCRRVEAPLECPGLQGIDLAGGVIGIPKAEAESLKWRGA